MNLTAFRTSIDAANGSDLLAFDFGMVVPGPGYLLTELRHAHLASIDCGHHQSRRDEAVIQLILGGKSSLTLDKLSGILDAAKISPEAEIVVEATPDNGALRLFYPTTATADDAQLILKLAPKRPVCAFAQRRARA